MLLIISGSRHPDAIAAGHTSLGCAEAEETRIEVLKRVHVLKAEHVFTPVEPPARSAGYPGDVSRRSSKSAPRNPTALLNAGNAVRR
jgi:hypothetical protein